MNVGHTFLHQPEDHQPHLPRQPFEVGREWQINRIPLPEDGYGVVCYFRDISRQVNARQRILDPGQEKTLRIYARGANGQDRMFEYREGSTVDGSQFRSWDRGEWGNNPWNGGWEGGSGSGAYGGGNDADLGRYVILNAQYGTVRRHVDVTSRLKELARQDRAFRMGNSTFGVDPDPGQEKTLRIYARGPNEQDRMFEYREGSMVDGSQFRSWSGGDWGNSPWNGGWEGGGREAQPEMAAAIQHLREAQQSLESASHDKGGHRVKALEHINQAIAEVEAGIQYDNSH